MARISVSLSGIERTLLNRLAEADTAVDVHTLRLATGKKIQSPRDAPSTFLALSGFESWLANVTSTAANVSAASSRITKVQSTLDQIRTQLNAVRTELLKDETRSLTPSERATAQAAIDEAIVEMNNLAGVDIDGRRMLDGSADYRVSGRNSEQVASVEVYALGHGAADWRPEISGTVLKRPPRPSCSIPVPAARPGRPPPSR